MKKYIAGQAEHHKKEDFKSELRRIFRERTAWSSMKNMCSTEVDACGGRILCPGGQNRENTSFHGGSLLHPWLQPAAPLGPNAPRVAKAKI